MKQFSQQMDWGFSVIGETTDQTLPLEQSLGIVGLLARMEEYTEHRTHHHHFCNRMMEFLDLVKSQYRAVGHNAKLVSKVPLSIIRYSLDSQPHCQAYRFTNIIYCNQQCTVDVTVPFKLKDHIRAEVKTVFDVTYTLKFNQEEGPVVRRHSYPEEGLINDVLATLKEISHPAFVLQALRGLTPLEHDRTYVGKIFAVKLVQETGDNFTITFTPNKAQGDKLIFTYRGMRPELMMHTPVNKAQLELDDQLLFEMLYCLQREGNYQTTTAKTMRRLRDYKHGK